MLDIHIYSVDIPLAQELNTVMKTYCYSAMCLFYNVHTCDTTESDEKVNWKEMNLFHTKENKKEISSIFLQFFVCIAYTSSFN
jgi:hypothetical protein